MNPLKTYSIEQSYINLAIVSAKEQHDKERRLRDAQNTHTDIDIFEEIYGTKTAIDVKDIFKTCKSEEKQVLVLGRAGIGKSTFSRYIAYQWAKGSLWQQYELLALIPLRCLTANRYPSSKEYSLIDLVKREVLQCDLTEKEETILKKHFNPKKTLWILDGHDEIIQDVPSHLQVLFEHLLNTPHHIITSRPYMNTLSYDVQMEITGFTDENIVTYVEQFFDQMKDELDNALVQRQTLSGFLKSNSRIWGLAHIPVNLELICSLWSNNDWSETQHLSMTRLYSEMTEWLCLRYLDPKKIQTDVSQDCQKELAFLEHLAFHAMADSTIIIRPSLLKRTRDEVQISFDHHLNILNFGVLKSYSRQGIGNRKESEKDHYFIHLSFQEYFAARYLVNALKGPHKETAIQFIQDQKYNQRYLSVFSFAAGLFTENDAISTKQSFWHNMLKEPLDLLGIRHMQLIISCIEETCGQSTFPERQTLLLCIGQFLQYNFLMRNSSLIHHVEPFFQRAQSLVCEPAISDIFIHLLRSDDTGTKLTVLSFISELTFTNPSPALIESVATNLNDTDDRTRMRTCSALGKMDEKAATNEVISKLVSALGDQSEYVRANACEALGEMGKKATTNEVISKLVSALGNQSEDVRANACSALGKMGEKAATNEVISKLVSALGDQSENVRVNACLALREMAEKAATNEVISKLFNIINEESSAWYAAAEAVESVLRSSSVLLQLDPIIFADLTLSEDSERCFRNISEDEIIKFCFDVHSDEWLNAIVKISLLKGTAVTVIKDKVFIYGRKDPSELTARNEDFVEKFIKTFNEERDRLHLSLLVV